MPKTMNDEVDERDYMVLRINAPEWLERDDFREWLNSGPPDCRRVAQWGNPGDHPEARDCFEVFTAGEAVTDTSLPEDIGRYIDNEARRLRIRAGILWISFLSEP